MNTCFVCGDRFEAGSSVTVATLCLECRKTNCSYCGIKKADDDAPQKRTCNECFNKKRKAAPAYSAHRKRYDTSVKEQKELLVGNEVEYAASSLRYVSLAGLNDKLLTNHAVRYCASKIAQAKDSDSSNTILMRISEKFGQIEVMDQPIVAIPNAGYIIIKTVEEKLINMEKLTAAVKSQLVDPEMTQTEQWFTIYEDAQKTESLRQMQYCGTKIVDELATFCGQLIELLPRGFFPLVETERTELISNLGEKRREYRAGASNAKKQSRDPLRAKITLLRSSGGGVQQGLHRDWKPGNIHADLPGTSLPLSWLLALESNTKILVKSSTNTKADEVNLNVGDCIILSGATVHAGAAYESNNIRIHGYINTPEHCSVEQLPHFV